MREKPGKKNAYSPRECVRMASLQCSDAPQAHALNLLRGNDRRAFNDFLLEFTEADLESSSISMSNWLNRPLGEAASMGVLDLGHISDSERPLTLLGVAVQEGRLEAVEDLLNVGARPTVFGEDGKTALHHVVASPNLNILKILLESRFDMDVNLPTKGYAGGLSPLHIAAGQNNPDSLKCLEFLLQMDDIDVDAKDVRGVETPLLHAIKSSNVKAVKLLIENGANLDLTAGPKTLREHLAAKIPDLDPRLINVKKRREPIRDFKDRLEALLRQTGLPAPGSNRDTYRMQLGQFKTYLRYLRSEAVDLSGLCELAAEKGLADHLDLMLKRGVDPKSLPASVLLEAAFHGHVDVLKVVLEAVLDQSAKDRPVVNLTGAVNNTGETVLHLVLKAQAYGVPQERYAACLDLLLNTKELNDQIKLIINKKDDYDNTALHLATLKWDQGVIRQLLEFGANIGMKNHWREIPISRIQPDTMQAFLDEFCLESKGDVMHEDFQITFRYDFLAPDVEALPQKFRNASKANYQEKLCYERKDQERPNEQETAALPETECLWYMSQSKEHRHLLKHPVITSFLWYKWKRIRRYYNRNLRFFTLYVFLLTWFVFIKFGSQSREKITDLGWYVSYIVFFVIMIFFILRDWISEIKDYQRDKRLSSRLVPTEDNGDEKVVVRQPHSATKIATKILANWIEIAFITFMAFIVGLGSSMLEVALTILLALLIFREVLQLSVSVKRYITSFENLLEITLIVLSFFIIYNRTPENFEINRHLGAIVILLSWAELIVLVGVHPKLKEYNIYVTMFLKVLKTFFFFLTWYSLFLIAFGFGFFIILHTDRQDIEQDEEDDPYVFFNTTWLSLVKTTTMFVGELEFSDIPINLKSPLAPLSYAFFISFVFLIVVVLMNLLNGLAVSDTGIIREKAEIFSYRSKVETISTLESMLLGDPFDFLSNVPAILASVRPFSLIRQLYRSPTVSKIFTFFGASEILLFYNFLPKKSVTIFPNKGDPMHFCHLGSDDMGRDIIDSAKTIISQKPGGLTTQQMLEAVLNRMTDLEVQIKNLTSKVDGRVVQTMNIPIKRF